MRETQKRMVLVGGMKGTTAAFQERGVLQGLTGARRQAGRAARTHMAQKCGVLQTGTLNEIEQSDGDNSDEDLLMLNGRDEMEEQRRGRPAL